MESILLTAISTLPREFYSNTFHYKNIDTQKCICQFEPVFDLLTQTHRNNIHVIALCTEETLEKTHFLEDGNPKKKKEYIYKEGDREISAVDYTLYRIEQRGFKRIKNTIEEDNSQDTFIFQKEKQKIFFTIFKTKTDNYIDCLKVSTNKIKHMLSNNDYHFWINANGAFRDMYLLIIAIISLMKVYKITPHHILLVDNNKNNTITDVDENFHIFDFVSGINDFVNFGHVKMLKEYYSNKEPSQLTNSLIDDINETYLGMQFNNYDYFENAVNQLKKDIVEAKETHDIDKTLATFLSIIENDFGEELLNQPNPLLMIKRCLNKKMYQHAATLIESNFEYFSDLFFKNADGNKYISDFAKNCYLNKDNLLDKNFEIGTKAIQDFSRYYRAHLHNGVYSDENDDFIKDLNNYQQHLTLISKKTVYITCFPCNLMISRKAALSISIYQVVKSQRNNLNHARSQTINIDAFVDTMKLFVTFVTEMMKYQNENHNQITKNVVNISGIDFNKWSRKDIENICTNANYVDNINSLNLSTNDGNLTKNNLEALNSRRPSVIVINKSDNYKHVIKSIENSKKQYLGKGKEYWIATENENGTITFNKYDKNDAIQQQEDSKN